MTESTPSRLDPAAAARFCATVARPDFSPGDRAALRRLDPAAPNVPAFWRLVCSAETAPLPPARERDWALILQGIAITTPRGGSAHAPGQPVGRALRDAGYSESRLARLLNARGDTLIALLQRLFRHLAAKDQTFDWREMAAFILFRDDGVRGEDRRMNIARAYYRAAAPDATAPTPAA